MLCNKLFQQMGGSKQNNSNSIIDIADVSFYQQKIELQNPYWRRQFFKNIFKFLHFKSNS